MDSQRKPDHKDFDEFVFEEDLGSAVNVHFFFFLDHGGSVAFATFQVISNGVREAPVRRLVGKSFHGFA